MVMTCVMRYAWHEIFLLEWPYCSFSVLWLDPTSLNQEEKNDIHTPSNDLLGESMKDMPPKCMQKEQCVVNKGYISSYSCNITNTMPSTTLRAGNKHQLSPRAKSHNPLNQD